MAENDFQLRTMTYAIEALAAHFRTRSDVYVSGDLFVYHEEDDNTARVAPDVFVVFGVPGHRRRTYLLWQEGKAPDFVMEVASPSTYRSDLGDKRDTYAGIGVSEYWLYDPIGGYHDPRLQGFRLVEGRYEPLPVTERTDGVLTGYSEALALALRLYPDDRFRFHDPASGRDLLSLGRGGTGARRNGRPSGGRLRAGSGKRKRPGKHWKPNSGRCGSRHHSPLEGESARQGRSPPARRWGCGQPTMPCENGYLTAHVPLLCKPNMVYKLNWIHGLHG